VAVRNSRGKDIDIHELLKREAFAASSAACDSHFEKNRPCADEPYGFSDQYIILDSWVKDLARSNPSIGLYSWNFMVQGVSGDQSVGVKDKIDTVIEIQIGSFMIPAVLPGYQMVNPFYNDQFVSGFPLLTAGAQLFLPPDPGAVMSYTFGFFTANVGRVTIELVEIGLQSISQRGGVRYHFEADVVPVFPTQGSLSTSVGASVVSTINPVPVALRVVPLPNFDTYTFTEPIKDVHGLTLAIRSIDQTIPFPLDVIEGCTAYTTDRIYPSLAIFIPLLGTDADATGRWLSNNVGLTRLSISGMKTGNVPIDNWVNQAPSLLASLPPGGMPGIGLDSVDKGLVDETQGVGIVIAPNVNITPLVPSAPSAGSVVRIHSETSIIVRFATSRIRIPMRLRRVVQRLTNYKLP
jgi:hypothetical protein